MQSLITNKKIFENYSDEYNRLQYNFKDFTDKQYIPSIVKYILDNTLHKDIIYSSGYFIYKEYITEIVGNQSQEIILNIDSTLSRPYYINTLDINNLKKSDENSKIDFIYFSDIKDEVNNLVNKYSWYISDIKQYGKLIDNNRINIKKLSYDNLEIENFKEFHSVKRILDVILEGISLEEIRHVYNISFNKHCTNDNECKNIINSLFSKYDIGYIIDNNEIKAIPRRNDNYIVSQVEEIERNLLNNIIYKNVNTKKTGKYYVYRHYYINENNEEITFYVGKGNGNRAFSMKDRNGAFNQILNYLKSKDIKYKLDIVLADDNEILMLKYESLLIYYFHSIGQCEANTFRNYNVEELRDMLDYISQYTIK